MGGAEMIYTIDGKTYGKPNMAALEGDVGRRIFEFIKNTPVIDFTEVDKRVDKAARAVVAARRREKKSK